MPTKRQVDKSACQHSSKKVTTCRNKEQCQTRLTCRVNRKLLILLTFFPRNICTTLQLEREKTYALSSKQARKLWLFFLKTLISSLITLQFHQAKASFLEERKRIFFNSKQLFFPLTSFSKKVSSQKVTFHLPFVDCC